MRPSATLDAAVRRDLEQRFFTPEEDRRLAGTLELLPQARGDRVLADIGGSVFWLSGFAQRGYREIVAIGRGGGFYDAYEHPSSLTVSFAAADAELDRFPIDDAYVDVVMCCELLEHFAGDPMHCFAEANRILKPGGTLIVTTPNVINSVHIVKLMLGQHPFSWSTFTDSYADRHNREYTPREVQRLVEAAGFCPDVVLTRSPYQHAPWFYRVLGACLALPAALLRKVPYHLRGEQIVLRATKQGPVRDRYPGFIYDLFGQSRVSRVH